MNWYFTSGDLDFFWNEQLRSLSWLPVVFRKDLGFGEPAVFRLWLDYPFRIVLKILSAAGLTWFIIEKLLWISVVIIAVYASYRLAVYVFGKKTLPALTAVIYATNTYILLLVTGGQLGIALAYAFLPVVLRGFIREIDTGYDKRSSIGNGLLLAVLIMFDLRFAYLLAAAVLLYTALQVRQRKLNVIGTLIVPSGVAASVHLFWILPVVFATGITGPDGQFTGPGIVKFLSFADFSHALSLLHPNWPENLFGKVYFLQPEFLILPLLAFSALFFRESKVRYFALLALIAVFVSKGIRDPFGAVYQWLFGHFPGFVMFRDPTKFYVLTALAYSLLIPFTVKQLKFRILPVLFIIFWILTLRGTPLSVARLPADYVQLKNMLLSDTVPSRTLWIPAKENFAYYSDTHPVVTSRTVPPMQYLSDNGIKYVIVPQDSGKRIFMKNYTFDPAVRSDLIASLSATPLVRIGGFGSVAVFENPVFSMRTVIPPDVPRQQQLANIGAVISLASLIAWYIIRRQL